MSDLPKALQKMAANAYEAIRNAYPDSVKYETNYNRLQKELQHWTLARREKIARAASNISSPTIPHSPTTHAITDCGRWPSRPTGKEPSAKQLTAVIRQAREDGVRRISYCEPIPGIDRGDHARDIDAEYVEIDPLDEDAIGAIDAMTDSITAK